MYEQEYKKTKDGYVLSTRLKMNLAQLNLLDTLQVGDSLTVRVKESKVFFYHEDVLIGEANPEIAPAIIHNHENFVSCTIKNIRPQFGVLVDYTISDFILVNLKEKGQPQTLKKEKKSRHDINHYSPLRLILYIMSLFLSLVMLYYSLKTNTTTMIIIMGIVIVSCSYLIVDQFRLYKKERTEES